MSVTETILQSFTFAFDTTKVIQIYETTKLFRLKFVNKMNFFLYIQKSAHRLASRPLLQLVAYQSLRISPKT